MADDVVRRSHDDPVGAPQSRVIQLLRGVREHRAAWLQGVAIDNRVPRARGHHHDVRALTGGIIRSAVDGLHTEALTDKSAELAAMLRVTAVDPHRTDGPLGARCLDGPACDAA